MNEQTLENFLNTVVDNKLVWLLQADDGLFAMLESDDQQSYLPVWAVKDEAENAIKDEWADYTSLGMELKEFITWLNELHDDKAWIGVAPDSDGKVLPFEADYLQKMLLGWATQ